MESIYRKLLDTTIKLMNEKGYHGISFQMIADKVGVSKSTLLYYFKNNEGILLATLEDVVAPVVYDLTAIDGGLISI